MVTLCMLIAGLGAADQTGGASPIRIEIVKSFATFTNADHPGNRIGYRFHEHTPLVFEKEPETPVTEPASPEPDPVEVERLCARPGAKTLRIPVAEEGWIPETWTFYLAPAPDGIDLLLVVETRDSGLPAYYGVQQCFRLGGETNAAWRRQFALTPAFSEFDAWAHADEDAKPSLTWVVRNHALQQLPASKETVGCRTPYGVAIDTVRSNGDLGALTHVGAYHALMLDPVDGGLILRQSEDRQWSCGVYWERTTHLTDHHPADCLHAIVNIGPIAPHSQRILRGKIYWVRGPGEALVRHWERDFPEAAGSVEAKGSR